MAEEKDHYRDGKKNTLIEQYKIAIELYKHEDNLNWTKLNHLFYINAGLWAVMGLIIKDWGSEPSLRPVIVMVSFIGAILSGALAVALWFGIKYMHNRKDRVIDIEEELVAQGGKHIVSPISKAVEEKGFLRRSPTTLMLRLVPIVLSAVWLIVLIVVSFKIV